MANVWKKQTIRYLKEGKLCQKSVKGAVPDKIESKRWYGTLKMASGKRKQIPLTEDEATSETLLRTLQHAEDKKRALGITETDERQNGNVQDALKAYVSYLEMKGNTGEYVHLCRQRLTRVFKAMKTQTLSDLNAQQALSALKKWKTLSLGTKNHYIRALKCFSHWLIRERYLRDDPFIGLRCFNAKTDRRRVRRPFTDAEFSALITTVEGCQKRYLGGDWQFLPADRVMLYRLAVFTGLRAKELSTLTIQSFDLTSKTLTVDASNTKNRKRAVLPLNETLSTLLPAFFQRLKGDALFPGSWITGRIAGKMLQRDLVRSGISSSTPGGVLDFHSLRYTFISNLAKANVHPAKAQRLARHSDINLTMNVYTHLDVDDLRQAVDSLPPMR